MGKNYPAVEQSSPAVEGFFHGICLQQAAGRVQRDGVKCWFHSIDKSGKRYRKNEKYKRAYHVNCQTCTPAYVLRLRGLNVVAKGKTRGSKSDYLSRGLQAWECWKTADGQPAKHHAISNWLKTKGYTGGMTPERYKEFFEEMTKEEGVYGLSIGWKGGGGHMTVLQRLHAGVC